MILGARPTIKERKDAHHLWSAEKDEAGRLRVVRSKEEPEMFLNDKERETAKEVCAAVWGLWGASLVDGAFGTEIPSGVVARLAKVASQESQKGNAYPRVYTWNELRRAFGTEVVEEIRGHVSDGMRVRMASRYLDVPFLVAADIIDRFGSTENLKEIVTAVKTGKVATIRKLGKAAGVIQGIYQRYTENGNHKLAIDEAAKKYYENYYGPFGKELTREIKRRVRADLAEAWLRKNGVDQKAVDYWSGYFSNGYGDEMVKELAKKLAPR